MTQSTPRTTKDKTEFLHPEQKDGEVFLTNASRGDFGHVPWKTKRLGLIAYDGEGERMYAEDWYPVFMQQRELLEAGAELAQARSDHRSSL